MDRWQSSQKDGLVRSDLSDHLEPGAVCEECLPFHEADDTACPQCLETVPDTQLGAQRFVG